MGLIKKILKLKLYVGLLGAGYMLHSCVNNDQRYRIRSYDHKPHLVDMYEHKSLEIYADSFQTGSPEYRLRGLLRECNLQEVIKHVEKDLEVKK